MFNGHFHYKPVNQHLSSMACCGCLVLCGKVEIAVGSIQNPSHTSSLIGVGATERIQASCASRGRIAIDPNGGLISTWYSHI